MSFEQIGITRSIFVLEQSFLHQNWSKFSDNSNESLKMAQNPKNAYGVRIILTV